MPTVADDWDTAHEPTFVDRESLSASNELAVVESDGGNSPTSPSSALPDNELLPMPETESSLGSAVPMDLASSVLPSSTQPAPESTTGRGQRLHQPSVKLKDYVMYNATSLEDPSLALHCSASSSSEIVQGKTLYPLTNFITDENFSASHKAFLAAITAGVEPRYYSQAAKDDIWRGAMKHEVIAHEESGTWDIESLPPDKKAIGCHWIFKYKYNADGTIERPKARLVADGNKQVEGDDFAETFSPVVKMGTIRALLGLVAAKGWEVHQMDVHNAFLHGDLQEEVYMKLPPGFTHPDPTKVCRLRKSLYGLRQAPRCWFDKLTTALTEYGFEPSYSDYSLFCYSKDSKELRVLIYVDDLVLASNDLALLTKFK